MKRIAIIVPSLYGGGAEKVAVLLSKGLLVRGNKVFLLALEGGLSYDIPRGVNYMQLSPLDGRANKLLKFFIMPYQWYQIAKFFNKYRIEFAISIMERPNLLLALLHILSIGRKIISVASVHTLLVERAANKLGLMKYAVDIKGMEVPGYDIRGPVGMALAYATADRGGDHLRAWTITAELENLFTTKGKAMLAKDLQDRNSALWCLIGCDNIPANTAGDPMKFVDCLLYTSPSPRDLSTSRMPSSA